MTFSKYTQRTNAGQPDLALTGRARPLNHCARPVAVLAGALAGVALAMPQQHGAVHNAEHAATHGSAEGVTGAQVDGAASLQLSRAWIRAMPPGQDMTAAYLTVANTTDTAITIGSVSASQGDASLHENRRVDGQVQMRALAELLLPAHGEAVLEPGGLHIMLTGLGSTPAEGDTLRLCLASTAGTACTDAPVRRRAPDATASSSDDAGHRH